MYEYMVSDIKSMRVASRRIRRDWAMCALSEKHICKKLNEMDNEEQLTKKNDARREGRHNGRITTLLHNHVNDRDGEGTKDGWKSAHPNIRDMVGRVAIPNIVEGEAPVEPDEPAGETEEQFGEGRVDVEVVFARYVVRREFAKVDLIKAGSTR